MSCPKTAGRDARLAHQPSATNAHSLRRLHVSHAHTPVLLSHFRSHLQFSEPITTTMSEPAQRLDVAASFNTALRTCAELVMVAAGQCQGNESADWDRSRSVLREGVRHLRTREKERRAISGQLLASLTQTGSNTTMSSAQSSLNS